MVRILHLSDFHISRNMNDILIQKKIIGMIDKLKESNYNIDILLFSGDVIDQKGIPKDEKKKQRLIYMKEEFDKAKKLFELIIDAFGIPKNKVIICCGNHDRFEGKSFNCKKDEEASMYEDYKLFNDFCKKLTGKENSYKTHIRKIDGINILVANSNWDTKKRRKDSCFNCIQIKKIIENSKFNLPNLNKKFNIFLSHSPIDTLCETAKYEYPENEYRATYNLIKEYFGLFCSGDKHTKHNNTNQFIIGNPLNESYISYNIYELDNENNAFDQKSLIYQNNKWSIENSYDTLNEIYLLSEPFVKKKAISILFDNYNSKNITIQNIRDWFEKNHEKCENISNLFKTLTTLQQAIKNESGKRINVKNIFDEIINIINISKTNNPLTIKGPTRLGKSTMLSFLYLYLIFKFSCGHFDYIPVYINLEMYKKDQNSNKKLITIIKDIDKIFKISRGIANSVNSNICFIIDGLNKYHFFGTDIEKEIMDIIENDIEISHGMNKYLYAIDTDKELRFEKTCFGIEKTAEYLIYFNVIGLVNVYLKDDKVKDFLKYYSNVFDKNRNSQAQIIKNINTLHISSIDFNFITNFYEELKQRPFSSTISNFYIKHFKREISFKYQSIAPKIAFDFYYNTQTIQYDFLKENKVNIKTFETIKNEKKLSEYLIAEYYIKNINNALKNLKYDSSVLNSLFNKNISLFIVDLIKVKNSSRLFVQFCEQYYSKLDNKGRSTLTYVLGRIGIEEEEKEKLLEEQYKILKNDNSETLYKSVALRSIYISRITSHPNNFKYRDEYLRLLFSSAYQRNINRTFNKLYYCDIALDEFDSEDKINQGFDFFHTFHYLGSRINNFRKEKIDYPLLELDLFLLCNIIQVRLQSPKVSNRNINSLFYHSKYNYLTNIVNEVIKYIEDYLNKPSLANNNYYLVKYFVKIKEDFNKFLNNKTNKGIPSFLPYQLINDFVKVGQIEKIDWKLLECKNVISDDYMEMISNNPSYETILEHIYSTYLIALLYLPNEISELDEEYKGYCKQKILNMILIQNIGKNKVGDFLPNYEKYEEKLNEENMYNENLFLSSIYNNSADIANLFEYYELWNDWSSFKKDINIVLAKELSKIQTLYKYYTLVSENKMDFLEERKRSFISEKENIKTNIGKKIYRIVIDDNYLFKK